MRLFISIELPEKIREKLFDIASGLKKTGMFEGKITEKENLHLTLKFLGEADEEKTEKVKKRLREIKTGKFSVILGEFGVFNQDFIKIIWAHLAGVDELQKKIDRALTMFPRENRFMGHVTIARVKNVKEKRNLIDEIKRIKLGNLGFEVSSFNLMKSELGPEGPSYSVIEKFDLE